MTTLVIVFLLTGVPAWAYALPALVLAVEVAMSLRASRLGRAGSTVPPRRPDPASKA